MRLSSDRGLEGRIAGLLTIGTYASVALLAAGVVALLAAGRSPLDDAPALDPGRIPTDLAALRPEGFLWLGLIAVIATPAGRVLAALIGYVGGNERGMALVAAVVLGIIALSVALATGTGG